MVRIAWEPVVAAADEVVRSYDTPVTLRQVFYRLVTAELIPNTRSAYKTLSARTARARREGWFPALADNTRSIERAGGWDGPAHALESLADQYRRPRDEGQDYQIWVLVEKRTLVEQLRAWFDPYGVAIVALGGYESETLDRMIRSGVAEDGRPAVGLYGGDMDPTGEDIERNLTDHCGHVYESLKRVALTWEQIDHHALPVLAGKHHRLPGWGVRSPPRPARPSRDRGARPPRPASVLRDRHRRVVRHDTVGGRDRTGTLRPGIPRELDGRNLTMIDSHQLRVVEALSDVYTAERRAEAAQRELDDRVAAANAAGHNQEEIADWLGVSQQTISKRLALRRARIAAGTGEEEDGKGRA